MTRGAKAYFTCISSVHLTVLESLGTNVPDAASKQVCSRVRKEHGLVVCVCQFKHDTLLFKAMAWGHSRTPPLVLMTVDSPGLAWLPCRPDNNVASTPARRLCGMWVEAHPRAAVLRALYSTIPHHPTVLTLYPTPHTPRVCQTVDRHGSSGCSAKPRDQPRCIQVSSCRCGKAGDAEGADAA